MSRHDSHDDPDGPLPQDAADQPSDPSTEPRAGRPSDGGAAPGGGTGASLRDALSLRDPRGQASDDGDPLDGFDEHDEPEPPTTWPPVLAGVLGIVLALILAIGSYSAFQRAEQLGEWANSTWVAQGAYTDLTRDLELDTFNPKYQISLPTDPQIAQQRFDNGLQDPFVPEPGQGTEVRGMDTGGSSADFEEQADILLGVEDGELQVLATEPAGELGTGVTDRSVAGQRGQAIALGVGSAVVLVAGLAAAFWLRRRSRR